jgi:hypothetical protein
MSASDDHSSQEFFFRQPDLEQRHPEEFRREGSRVKLTYVGRQMKAARKMLRKLSMTSQPEDASDLHQRCRF